MVVCVWEGHIGKSRRVEDSSRFSGPPIPLCGLSGYKTRHPGDRYREGEV